MRSTCFTIVARNSAPDHLHTHFDLGLVQRFTGSGNCWPGRQDFSHQVQAVSGP